MLALLDKVVLIASIDSDVHYNTILEYIYQFKNEYQGKGKHFWKTKYATKVKVNLGDENIVLSVGTSGKGKALYVKFDFNAGKLNESEWKNFYLLVNQLFEDGSLNGYSNAYDRLRVSKLEFAADFKGVKFSSINCVDSRIKTFNFEYAKKGSIYIGSKISKREFCIYDKAKELSEKNNQTLNYELLRVECRIRDSSIYLKDLHKIINPFLYIHIFDINKDVNHANGQLWDNFKYLIDIKKKHAQEAYLNFNCHEKKVLEMRIALRQYDWWKPAEIWDKSKSLLTIFQPEIVSNIQTVQLIAN